MGGFLGALFNAINTTLSKWRLERVKGKKLRMFLEVLGVSLLTSILSFILPYFFGFCGPAQSKNFFFFNFFNFFFFF